MQAFKMHLLPPRLGQISVSFVTLLATVCVTTYRTCKNKTKTHYRGVRSSRRSEVAGACGYFWAGARNDVVRDGYPSLQVGILKSGHIRLRGRVLPYNCTPL